jgi:hypothetical protein
MVRVPSEEGERVAERMRWPPRIIRGMWPGRSVTQ